jgi:hypothetical protein
MSNLLNEGIRMRMSDCMLEELLIERIPALLNKNDVLIEVVPPLRILMQ